MPARPLADLPDPARHVVASLHRVIPTPAPDERTQVVWLFGHSDNAARLATDPALMRKRYPAHRYTVTVVLPSRRLVPWPCDDIRTHFIGFSLLEISDAAFVQQLRALCDARLEVALDGRLFVTAERRWFLSDRMADLMAEENTLDYLHPGDLQVQLVPQGVVHPLALGRSGRLEDHQWGGVTDAQGQFVPLSATQRVAARRLRQPAPPWYVGPHPEAARAATHVDEDVVFLGPLSKHVDHFLLEGLARLWFLLDGADLARTKVVYLSEPGPDRFNELFGFFGLKPHNVMRIGRPTAFRTVIVPEQAMRLQQHYHPRYKQTLDCIAQAVPAGPHRQVYFSTTPDTGPRSLGETPMEAVFARNGFHLCRPERLTMAETIATLKGCEVFAAPSGSPAHHALFLPDGARCISLNRSPHVHPVQTMIDRMKQLDAVYVDAHVSPLPADWRHGPFLFGPTRHLFDFFDHAGFEYDALAMKQAFTQHLADHMAAWAQAYGDPQQQARLEPAEQQVPLADLAERLADTFVRGTLLQTPATAGAMPAAASAAAAHAAHRADGPASPQAGATPRLAA